MARDAWPQQGLFPLGGAQCGPYTANEWAAWMSTGQRAGGMVRTGAVSPPGLPVAPLFPNVGVYYGIPSRLEVTEAANQINVETGAWLCDGRFGFNDSQIKDVVPVAGNRTDYVVVRQNHSAVDFDTGPAGAALTVEANTCDITIIDSTNFTQDQDRATYWDLPLASYDIAAANITNAVDLREWVDAEEKRYFVPALIGYNIDTTNTIILSYAAPSRPTIELPDGVHSMACGRTVVPHDYISGFTATGIYGTCAANPVSVIFAQNTMNWGACTETFSGGGQSTTGFATEAQGGALNTYGCAREVVGAPSIDDIVELLFERDANGDDTMECDVFFFGWEVTYLGWGRK